MHILVVEDEVVQARVLRTVLEKRGHTVTVASDGDRAWRLLEERHFPLVVSDWLMPCLDGPGLCRRIRARERAPYTYVLLLTTKTTRDDRLEGLRAGADDFLAKPVDVGELAARLEIAARILTMQQALHDRSRAVDEANERLRRQNTRLTEMNAEMEQFASVACHDLQEPLRKIQVFGGRLRAGYGDALGARGEEFLKRIEGAAGRMQALVRDLFQLTQVDQVPRPFVPVDMGLAAREALTDLEARLEETQGEVEVGSLPTVTGDPLQMRQLLLNLIGNGLKYHRPEAPPRVSVTACRESGADGTEDRHRITVRDNGIGFDERYLDRIFQPFQRLHGRGEYEGTGIGLAICRKIVERHGGTLTARSAPGEGAAFMVSLPDVVSLPEFQAGTQQS